MNLSALFINRPIATALLMVGLLLLGLVAYPLLPVASLPSVNYPTISVTSQLPGADPQTMAATVTSPLELQFGEIPGVAQMTSSSTLGESVINVQFNLSTSINAAAADVLAAINAANGQLPPNLTYPPTIRKVNPADTPILVLAVTSDAVPLTTVDAYAENILMQKISQIAGVGLVGIGGQQKPAIRVQVNPQALAARGISLEDVRSVLGNANVDLPKGTLNSPSETYTLNTNDQLLKPSAYENLIVAYQNGAPVRVRDIGQAISGPENDQQAGWYNGKRAIILAVQREPDANVIGTVDRVKAMLPLLEASIPPAIHVSILSDRTQTIRASISDVQHTLLLTVALVVMVIFLFLRNARATLIPAVTVPLSLIGTFAVLYALGYSLDNLSLMALTIAVGFVVDDAVVVIENTHRHLEAGLGPVEAALKSAGEIGFTVVSITVSLIAVFIPLFLMSGYVGLLFREFAVAVSVSLILSLIIALTLTPMMCAHLLKPEHEAQHGRLYRLLEAAFDGLLSAYERGLKVVLLHRFLTLLVMLGTIVLTGYLFILIPKGFFPQQDTGLIIAVPQAADDISFQAMEQKMEAAFAIILKDPAVASIGAQIGASGAQTLNEGKMFITLKPESQRTASADQVIRRLGTKLASLDGLTVYMQAAQDITIGARVARTQYQYTLVDADSAELAHWAPIFLGKLKSLPEITDVASDQESAGPLLDVTVNRDVASSYGISAGDDRQYPRRRLRPAHRVDDLHDAQSISRHPRGRAAVPVEPAGAEPNLHPLGDRPGGAARSAGQERHPRGAAHRQSSGPVPVGDAVVQPEAGRRARPGGQRHSAGQATASRACLAGDELPGQCPSLHLLLVERADPDRGDPRRDLHHSGCSLREPDPPDHDHLDPALGRPWRPVDADRLSLRSQRHRDHRHHPIDRHRQEERDHADRLSRSKPSATKG